MLSRSGVAGDGPQKEPDQVRTTDDNTPQVSAESSFSAPPAGPLRTAVKCFSPRFLEAHSGSMLTTASACPKPTPPLRRPPGPRPQPTSPAPAQTPSARCCPSQSPHCAAVRSTSSCESENRETSPGIPPLSFPPAIR